MGLLIPGAAPASYFLPTPYAQSEVLWSSQADQDTDLHDFRHRLEGIVGTYSSSTSRISQAGTSEPDSDTEGTSIEHDERIVLRERVNEGAGRMIVRNCACYREDVTYDGRELAR